MQYSEKIIVIGDHDTCVGFSLAGVSQTISVSQENCEENFIKTISRQDAGVIILQEDLAAGFSHKTKKIVENLSRPVVVTVPGKTEAAYGKKSGSIQELVKRAIGIELKS